MSFRPPGQRFRRSAAAVLAFGLATLSAACGGANAGDGGRPQVTAATYPLAFVAERLAGGHAEVVNLTSPGTDPHDLELTVQQTADVAEADIVVYQSGLQPAVDETVEQHGPDVVVDAAEVVDLLPMGEESGHEGETAEEHAEHAHDHGEVDPHFWLDPQRMGDLAVSLERRLVEADPDHAGAYTRNLIDLRRDLDRLDAAFSRGLADCETDTVVVSHDAFGYLEKYGLHFEPIAGLSPDAEPSPAHLAELADVVRSEGVTTVFTERLASPQLAETLARELDVQTAVLDPVEGLTSQTADEDYLSLMRANLDALRKANSCR